MRTFTLLLFFLSTGCQDADLAGGRGDAHTSDIEQAGGSDAGGPGPDGRGDLSDGVDVGDDTSDGGGSGDDGGGIDGSGGADGGVTGTKCDGTPAGYAHLTSLPVTTITTVAQLEAMTSDGHYKLGADLVIPAGYTSPVLRNIAFDGGGRTIEGLSIDRQSINRLGLFGDVTCGYIHDVKLVSASVKGSTEVGALVGYAEDSLIVGVTGDALTVRGAGKVGGLIGLGLRTTLRDVEVKGVNAAAALIPGAQLGPVGGVVGLLSSADVYGNAVVAAARFGAFSVTASGTVVIDTTGNSVVSIGAGVLAGKAHGVTIEDCRTGGSVEGIVGGNLGGVAGAFVGDMRRCVNTAEIKGGNAGGLVGLADNLSYGGNIEDSSSSGNITRGGRAGGLVGQYSGGNLKRSFASGRVEGSGSVGGLVGWFEAGDINDCYATGEVVGSIDVGGLVGRLMSGRTISNSYAKGRVTGDSRVGGLVGKSEDGAVASVRSVWDKDTSGQPYSDGGRGLTTGQFADPANFAGWDFDKVWKSEPVHPSLR